MAVMKVRSLLQGWTGAPGYVALYFAGSGGGPVSADAADVAARVRAFWFAVRGFYPVAWTADVNRTVDVINDPDGKMTGQLDAGAQAQVVGSGTGNMGPATIGYLLQSNTANFFNGRKVHGRMYMVPVRVAATGFTVPQAGDLTTIVTAATAMLTGGTSSFPVVYHRPSKASPNGGQSFPVVSYGAWPQWATLRSRRD